MITVLVTGKHGQLSKCIESITQDYANINFIFKSSSELNITNKAQVESIFNSIEDLDYCINCAAYTAVDLANTEEDIANNVNHLGAQNLAYTCNTHKVTLIHISTDFVFDGRSTKPYSEDDFTNPLNVYGKTKLKGEQAIIEVLQNHFIIRTSWLYSEYGNNFLKTMMRLGNERDELSVVDDQVGSPTYAKDLAVVILKFIETESTAFGIYNYCNDGICSWYDFAKEIFFQTGNNIRLKRIKTKDYPTPAVRPKYSVMSTLKVKEILGIQIPVWRDSLASAILNIKEFKKNNNFDL